MEVEALCPKGLKGSPPLDCVVPPPSFRGWLPARSVVNGTLTAHLYSASLPHGWSAPEATAAHVRSLSV